MVGVMLTHAPAQARSAMTKAVGFDTMWLLLAPFPVTADLCDVLIALGMRIAHDDARHRVPGVGPPNNPGGGGGGGWRGEAPDSLRAVPLHDRRQALGGQCPGRLARVVCGTAHARSHRREPHRRGTAGRGFREHAARAGAGAGACDTRRAAELRPAHQRARQLGQHTGRPKPCAHGAVQDSSKPCVR